MICADGGGGGDGDFYILVFILVLVLVIVGVGVIIGIARVVVIVVVVVVVVGGRRRKCNGDAVRWGEFCLEALHRGEEAQAFADAGLEVREGLGFGGGDDMFSVVVAVGFC